MSYRIEDLSSVVSAKGGFARSNLFRVQLPPIVGVNTRQLNLLCKSVELPGRTIQTTQSQIGLPVKNIANGFAVAPISMTFRVLNDPEVLYYFNAWMELCVDNRRYEVGYYSDYAANKTVKIDLLKKGITQEIYNQQSALPLPNFLANRISNIGPFNFQQGRLDLGKLTDDSIAYRCILQDPYPNAITPIALSDDNDNGLVELTVSITYKNWVSGEADAISSFFDRALDSIVDRTIGRVSDTVDDFVDKQVDKATRGVTKFLDRLF